MIRRIFGNLHFLIVLAAVMAAGAGLIAVVSQAQERKADRAEITVLRAQLHLAEKRDAKHTRELADAAHDRDELLEGQRRLLDYLAEQGYDIPDSVLRPIFRGGDDSDSRDDDDDDAEGSGKQSPLKSGSTVKPSPPVDAKPDSTRPARPDRGPGGRDDEGRGGHGQADRADAKPDKPEKPKPEQRRKP